MYIALARAGFIATTIDVGLGDEFLLLLPEIQSAYALLDWENLHASKSMQRWMKSEACLRHDYRLEIGYDLKAVLNGIWASHPDNWMKGPYVGLLEELNEGTWNGFKLMPIGW